jgi:hypothetical protein
VALLVQQSVAVQIRVQLLAHGVTKFVRVVKVRVILVPQHWSKVFGMSHVQALPHSSVRGPAQKMTGGLVSTNVTVSVHTLRFVQQSAACHVSVRTSLQGPGTFVKTLRSVTVTLLVQQASNAAGGMGVQGVPLGVTNPHGTTWLLLQMITGGVVSVMVMMSVQLVWFPLQSMASHVMLMVSRHGPEMFVTTFNTLICTFVPQQASRAVGGIGAHAEPHGYV